jgi:hypothetical protein
MDTKERLRRRPDRRRQDRLGESRQWSGGGRCIEQARSYRAAVLTQIHNGTLGTWPWCCFPLRRGLVGLVEIGLGRRFPPFGGWWPSLISAQQIAVTKIPPAKAPQGSHPGPPHDETAARGRVRQARHGKVTVARPPPA